MNINNLNGVGIPNQKTLSKAVNFLTPNKTINDYFGTTDTTVSGTKPLLKNVPYSTPRSKSSMSDFYENSIQTPIKKVQRRECTPDSPDREEMRVEEVDNNFSFMMTDSKMNNKDKMSKSKFMESIEKANTTVQNTSYAVYLKEAEDILNKLKGSYLLDLIEGGNQQITVFHNVLNDSILFNQITMVVCYTFFEGFNTRSDLFFKFMVSNWSLPLDTFNSSGDRRSTGWLV
jgi:hypothetical protein